MQLDGRWSKTNRKLILGFLKKILTLKTWCWICLLCSQEIEQSSQHVHVHASTFLFRRARMCEARACIVSSTLTFGHIEIHVDSQTYRLLLLTTPTNPTMVVLFKQFIPQEKSQHHFQVISAMTRVSIHWFVRPWRHPSAITSSWSIGP